MRSVRRPGKRPNGKHEAPDLLPVVRTVEVERRLDRSEQRSKAKDVCTGSTQASGERAYRLGRNREPMDRWRLRPSHPQHAPANLYVSPPPEREQKDDEPRGASTKLESTIAVEVKLFT